jgi:hypothetical protein
MLEGTLQYPYYKNGRKLTTKEEKKILPKEPLDKASIWHGYNFIKMNSTYLETVNNCFFLKGNAYLNSLFAFYLVAPIFIMVWGVLFYSVVFKEESSFLAFLVVFSPLHLIWVGGFFIFYKVSKNLNKYEKFGYNYYPIRFNRKNKKVYVYDVTGNIFEGEWDKIDFVLNSRLGGYEGTFWEVKGFIKDDQDIITYTFAFALGKDKKQQTLEIWEFIKTYMSEGPESLYYNKNASDIIGRLPRNKLSYCLDIENKPESLERSKQIVALDYQSEIRSFYSRAMINILGFCRNKFITVIKQPIWPKSVEDVCIIYQNDPYVVDASTTYQLDTYGRVIKS